MYLTHLALESVLIIVVLIILVRQKHTDLVKAFAPKEAHNERKPSGNRSEECCLTGWVCPVR